MTSHTSSYLPAPHIAYRVIDGQVVIVIPGENRMLTLNKTGSALWTLLDGRSLEDAVSELEATFEVEREALQRDVRTFIDEMESRQLLVKG